MRVAFSYRPIWISNQKVWPIRRPLLGLIRKTDVIRTSSAVWTKFVREYTTNPKENGKADNENEAKKTTLISKEIRENLYTLPNMLTVSRLIASPIIGLLVVQGHNYIALSLFAYSCITDFLDGFIARKYNLQSVAGSVIDPLADKVLLVTLATCLGISGDIPMYMTGLILGRDALLGLSAVYYRYISLPPPLTFKRYWDFSIPSAEVRPTLISKYNTFLQMIYLGSSLIYPAIVNSASFATYNLEWLGNGITGLGYVVGLTTIASGLSYVISKDAVKIVGGRKR